MTAAIRDLFSPDYETARANFRDRARRLGWECTAHPVTGDVGSPTDRAGLTTDVAVSAPPLAHARVLVISSGLHGVEGFFGSAAQVAFMDRWARETTLRDRWRAVLIHALNPYGFAHGRRADGANVDPNRNFVLDEHEYRGSPDAYARLDPLLNPARPPSRWDLFPLRAGAAIVREGLPRLRQAIAAGQHDFPRGLFFGGHSASPARRLLESHLGTWIGRASSVVHLDLHTGLGRTGEWKLLVDYPIDERRRRQLVRAFGPNRHAEGDPSGVAYQAHGSLGPWTQAQALAPDYIFAFAEFGTYGNLAILTGLRAENQAHHWTSPTDPARERTKARLRELFCPSDERWRAKVIDQSGELFEKSMALARDR